jgi:hypothetical protein
VQNNNILTVLLVALAAFLLFVLYKRGAAAPMPAALNAGGGAVPPPSPGPSRPSAGSYSSSVYSSLPGGGYLDRALNKPITNIRSGDVKGTLLSIGTGGVTDVLGI